MSLSRLFSKCLVAPEGIEPSCDALKVVGTFNPGVTEFDGKVYFLIRVAEIPTDTTCDRVLLPYAKDGVINVASYKDEDVKAIDNRIVRLKSNGLLRLTNISHLRLAVSSDGVNIDSIAEKPTLFPEEPYEEFGIEDARITFIEGKFYITYVAVSRHGAVTALASTEDFVSFERHGIIFPADNKDVVIFPEKISDDYVAFHRPLSAAPFSMPEMWIARSPDLLHWGKHQCLAGIGAGGEFRVGAGTPPIKTREGWLEIYHGSYKASTKDTVGMYWGRLALFDLKNPEKLIAQSKQPILVPETDYDRSGFLENIVFPTGVIKKGSDLFVYYGAADTYTAVAKLSLQSVLDTVVF